VVLPVDGLTTVHAVVGSENGGVPVLGGLINLGSILVGRGLGLVNLGSIFHLGILID